MLSSTESCQICNGVMEEFNNPFFTMQAYLIHEGAKVSQHLCTSCGHGLVTHDIPPELLYNTSVALPVEYVDGDIRFSFIAANLSLESISGDIVEFGGGPGELAEQARLACQKPRATVVDFVNRLASDKLDFKFLNLETDAASIPDILADSVGKRNLFLLSHVIEHLRDPLDLLRQFAHFSDSAIFIEVPDFGVEHVSSTVKFSLNHLEHLHYFTRRSLVKLMEKAGYEILALEIQSLPRMPAIRVLCAPPGRSHNAVLDYQSHFFDIAERFKQKLASTSPGQKAWIWGLSPFMAQALSELDDAHSRVAGIFDTRYTREEFLQIPVRKAPDSNAAAPEPCNLVICGSIYPAVQKILRVKAAEAFPDAEFFAILP